MARHHGSALLGHDPRRKPLLHNQQLHNDRRARQTGERASEARRRALPISCQAFLHQACSNRRVQKVRVDPIGFGDDGCGRVPTHAPADPRFQGGSFSTVVRVDQTILTERGAAATLVHGISDEESNEGPDFKLAWRRFLTWTEDLLNTAVFQRRADSDDEEEPGLPRLLPDPPVLLIAGHNSVRFDFALLLCECLRHRMSCDCFRRWLFVDTLHVIKALAEHSCKKLGCMVKTLGTDLRAHRALDDCIALRHVGVALAERVGMTLPMLLEQFALELDLDTSVAQISVLMSA